jgi:outer membrane protein
MNLMSISRRAALLAAACSLGLMTGLASVAQAETLTDALALAYQTNPTLQAQRANQRVTDEGVVQAKTAFRPTISGSADVAASRTDFANDQNYINSNNQLATRSHSTASGSGADLALTQPLYTGGRSSANLTAAQADVLAGREDLRSVEQSVLGNVIQSYVDVRRDQERLRIAQENVSVLNRQLEESKARFEVGEITRTDVAQSEARLAAAQASLSSAQAILAASRAAYAAVVGQNPTDLAPEPSLAALLPTSVEQAFDLVDKNNPSIQAARYAQQAAAARVAVARSAYRPTVSARAGLGWDAEGRVNGAGSQFGDYDRALTGSITASVPIFTGGLTSSQVRAATERENAARIAVEGAQRSALQQISTAWNNLLASRANLVSNEEQVRATKIAFEGVRQEQQVGLRTTLDVLNAQLELANAEVALVVARRDEYVASASVLQAMGVLNVASLAPDVERYDPVKSYDKVNHAFGWVPWEPLVQGIDKVGAPSTAVKGAPAPGAAK